MKRRRLDLNYRPVRAENLAVILSDWGLPIFGCYHQLPKKEMGTYQYHLTAIPRQAVLRHWDIIPVKVKVHDNPAFDEKDLVNVKWWEKENIDFGTIEKIILAFADQVEWTKNSEIVKDFGDNERNDITIVKGKTGLLKELSFRIDLREIDRSFIDTVLTFVKALDCILLDRQLKNQTHLSF